MALQDWELASLTIANVETMFEDPSLAGEMAAVYRRSTSAANWLSHRLASEQIDVSDLASRIAVPALVVHERFFRLTSFEICRQVAASIPGSRFISAADHDAVAEALADFIGSPDVGASSAGSRATAWARETESGLSARELEVLRLLAQGKSNPEIAKELFITRNTVQNHVGSILIKTNLSNRTEAAVYARDHGIA
jgi:DNA-binding CsgD family transcriptional regulator